MFNLLALLFYTFLTILVTHPLIFHLTDYALDAYDALLINWIINWGVHALSAGQNILNANIFFPFKNTFAYSDFHFISILTSAPFVIFFKEPLLAENINYLLGYTLTAFATFLLVKQLTDNKKVALLAGTLFSFGTIHINYSHHLQLFGFWPFILTLYFFNREKLKIFIVLFFLTVATMPLFLFFFLAYFIFAPKKNLKHVFFAFFIGGLVFVPYYLVSREFNYVRPITDAINFSLKIHDFFKPNINSRFQLYTGLGTVIFMLLATLKKVKINYFLILSAVSLILAFGPAFHIFENTVHVGPLPAIPMPYTLLYYLLPGFSGFRTPSRWILLAFFALVVGLSIALKNKITKKVTVLFILIIVLEIPFPFAYTNISTARNFPPEQVWLSKQPANEPIIQFPIYGWFDGDKVAVETLRMHYSTIHFNPMFNGYSGFSPKSWENDVQWLQKEFPSDKSLDYIESKKIKLILVPTEWRLKMLKFKQIKLIKSFSETSIYGFTNNNNE